MRFEYFLPIVVLLVMKASYAQDEYATPSTWKGTNITVSIADRHTTILAAIQEVLNGVGNLSSSFFSVLAVYDLYDDSHRDSFKDMVITYFTNNSFASNEFEPGLDAIRAYQVYQDSTLLEVAKNAWSFGRTLTISGDNLATGSMPSKSFNLTKICSGATLVGGTFWRTDADDEYIMGISTAIFFTLSAYLYQATSDNTYLDAAQDTGAFMIDIMKIASVNNGMAAMSANNSDSCGDVIGAGSFRIDQAGYLLEGLAILPNDTTFGLQNLSVETLRSDLVNITLTTNIFCNASNGIINFGNIPLVQGLGSLYRTISATLPANLVTYIGDFLSVQYNTIVTSATNPNSNVYAGSWIGPPVSQYSPENQTQALYALVNAAQVTQTPINASNSTTNGTNHGGNEGGDHASTGAIAGAAVGGLLVLAAAMVFTIRYRRRTVQEQDSMEPNFKINALYIGEKTQQLNTNNRPLKALSPKTLNGTRNNRNGYENVDRMHSGKQRSQMQMMVNSGPNGESRFAEPTGEMQVVNLGPNGESRFAEPASEMQAVVSGLNRESRSGDPASEDMPPTRSDSGAQLGQLSTNDLLEMLQARIQQQGRPEQGGAPPAYDALGSD